MFKFDSLERLKAATCAVPPEGGEKNQSNAQGVRAKIHFFKIFLSLSI
jgi:hypothetical protein